ncbi:MAG: DUF4870 domain-containing protein [Cytophagales bacterium]|nr:DUF4870 domain-containing protein [Cytophagales bacterium]
MEYTSEEKNWAMACHLTAFSSALIPFGNFIFPLIIWLSKKKESAFVDQHGRASLNFQISIFIYAMIVAIVAFFGGIGTIVASAPWNWDRFDYHFSPANLLWLLPVAGAFIFLFFVYVILIIVASVRAADGKPYRYPLTISFL